MKKNGKKGEKTEQKILEVALDLFVRKGYKGTSINEITKKSGLTPGALYFHFKSKKELVFRLFREYETAFIDRLVQGIENHDGDAIHKLHYVISFLARFAIENPNLGVFFVNVGGELQTDPEFAPAHQQISSKLYLAMRDIFRLGIRQGLLNKELDPDVLSSLYISFTNGIYKQWMANRHMLDGEQLIRNFRTLFFKGIGP